MNADAQIDVYASRLSRPVVYLSSHYCNGLTLGQKVVAVEMIASPAKERREVIVNVVA